VRLDPQAYAGKYDAVCVAIFVAPGVAKCCSVCCSSDVRIAPLCVRRKVCSGVCNVCCSVCCSMCCSVLQCVLYLRCAPCPFAYAGVTLGEDGVVALSSAAHCNSTATHSATQGSPYTLGETHCNTYCNMHGNTHGITHCATPITTH